MHSGKTGFFLFTLALTPCSFAQRIDFARDIQPVFDKSCYGCHGEKRQMAGLRLDSRSSVLAKSVHPGKAAESELYRRVAGIGDQARMPMGGKLDPGSSIASVSGSMRERIGPRPPPPRWRRTGVSCPLCAPPCREPLKTRSTGLSWRGWRRKGSDPRPKPTASRCCAG